MLFAEQIPLIPEKIGQFVFRGNLGEGATSVVKLAFDTNSKTYFACKVISKTRLSTEARQQKFEMEIRIMQELHHPGIVELHELLQDDNFYYVFMEFCSNGELFDYIVNHKKLNENESKNMLRQLVEALKYIHSKGIAHRDLKPENLLLDTFHHIKLTDFGLSKKFIDTNSNHLCKTPCGSPFYTSPETLNGSLQKSYDPFKADIWSAGVILYVMVTGMVPWTAARNSIQLYNQIKKGEYTTPTFLSDSCRDLINRMMCVDVEKRITLDEILKHKFMLNAEKVLTAVRDKPCAVSAKMLDEFFGISGEEFNKIIESAKSLNTSPENASNLNENEKVTEKPPATNIRSKKQAITNYASDIIPTINPNAYMNHLGPRRFNYPNHGIRTRRESNAEKSSLLNPPPHLQTNRKNPSAKIAQPFKDTTKKIKRPSWNRV